MKKISFETYGQAEIMMNVLIKTIGKKQTAALIKISSHNFVL